MGCFCTRQDLAIKCYATLDSPVLPCPKIITGQPARKSTSLQVLIPAWCGLQTLLGWLEFRSGFLGTNMRLARCKILLYSRKMTQPLPQNSLVGHELLTGTAPSCLEPLTFDIHFQMLLDPLKKEKGSAAGCAAELQRPRGAGANPSGGVEPLRGGGIAAGPAPMPHSSELSSAPRLAAPAMLWPALGGEPNALKGSAGGIPAGGCAR